MPESWPWESQIAVKKRYQTQNPQPLKKNDCFYSYIWNSYLSKKVLKGQQTRTVAIFFLDIIMQC